MKKQTGKSENTGNTVNKFSVPKFQVRRHFRFNIVSVLLVFVFLVLGSVLEYVLSGDAPLESLALMNLGVFLSIGVLFLFSRWPVVLIIMLGTWVAPLFMGVIFPFFSGLVSCGIMVASGVIVVNHWDKLVVLRLGRFHRLKGPGTVFIIPFFDVIAEAIDTRIRVTDFSAEKSITLDTVPVHIDALAFWMIWDAEKAVLEVQDFEQAVSLSAQTALRATIGSNSLTALLCERERLGNEIQGIVDAKTNPWGISILSVEFKEIIIPKELEDTLSREAQAERECKARNMLSHAEAEISKLYSEAAKIYKHDPTALKLRAMNMIYESMRNKGGLILAPASALETMNLGTALGAAAYGGNAEVIPDIFSDENITEEASSAEEKNRRGVTDDLD